MDPLTAQPVDVVAWNYEAIHATDPKQTQNLGGITGHTGRYYPALGILDVADAYGTHHTVPADLLQFVPLGTDPYCRNYCDPPFEYPTGKPEPAPAFVPTRGLWPCPDCKWPNYLDWDRCQECGKWAASRYTLLEVTA